MGVNKFIIFLGISLWCTGALSEDDPLETEVVKSTSPQKGPMASLHTKISKPMELRDPFKPPHMGSDDKSKKTSMINGTYTNIQTLDSINLDNIVVTGIVILSNTNRRAIITSKGSSDTPIVIQEGQKIADGKVQLKAIFEKNLHFIEEITNVYGQKEILETKVPLSE